MRYVTMNETWVYHYTAESNRQTAEWAEKGGNRPKRPKTQMSVGKVLVCVFWDGHGILVIEYLENRKTINSEYYMALLVHMKEEIAKKQPQMKKKKCSFIKTMHRVTSQS